MADAHRAAHVQFTEDQINLVQSNVDGCCPSSSLPTVSSAETVGEIVKDTYEATEVDAGNEEVVGQMGEVSGDEALDHSWEDSGNEGVSIHSVEEPTCAPEPDNKYDSESNQTKERIGGSSRRPFKHKPDWHETRAKLDSDSLKGSKKHQPFSMNLNTLF